MSVPRKPAAFRIEPTPPATAEPRRTPRAVPAVVIEPAEINVFDEAESALPATLPAPRRRSMLATVFFTAFGVLVSLALGLWVDSLVRDLFARAEWLGWVAAGAAALGVLAAVVMLARELAAISRLASIEKLRARAADAIARDDQDRGRALVDDLVSFMAGKPETAAGRRALEATRGEIIDGAALVKLAEIELLAPLDARATTLVLDAAKRVSVVTAVSPRALVDLVYVLYESGRLVRRLAELYGGRPGTLGFFRLARSVLAHLAATGAIAAGDDFVQQVVGQGLAARLSARLGEGVVNGMMTARIGVAAMDVTRPLPFSALKRPGMGDFLAALTRLTKTPRDVPPGA